MSAVGPTLEAFFTERLMSQKRASQHTIAAYRDGFRLLLAFAQDRSGKAPSQLEFDDLDAPAIGAFLDYLERERGNSAQTRNARLAAIHSLFRFAALRHPEHAALIARVLAIPPKRFDRVIVPFLERAETDALLAAPDRDRWSGRRDHALLTVAIQTGMRVSELRGLTCQDAQLGSGAHIRCQGKGRKQRSTPLTRSTAKVLAAWMRERAGEPGDPLFPPAVAGRSAETPSSCWSPVRHDRRADAPDAARQIGLAPHTSSYLRHELAAVWGRPRRHGAVAGPCQSAQRRALHPCGHGHQGTRSGANRPDRLESTALPAPGSPHGVPRNPRRRLCRGILSRVAAGQEPRDRTRHNSALGIIAELGVRDRDRLGVQVDVAAARRQASPCRMPVTASSPMSVRQVSARNAGWSVRPRPSGR